MKWPLGRLLEITWGKARITGRSGQSHPLDRLKPIIRRWRRASLISRKNFFVPQKLLEYCVFRRPPRAGRNNFVTGLKPPCPSTEFRLRAACQKGLQGLRLRDFSCASHRPFSLLRLRLSSRVVTLNRLSCYRLMIEYLPSLKHQDTPMVHRDVLRRSLCLHAKDDRKGCLSRLKAH